MVEWNIHGMEFGNCNCAPGCPCQFSQLPTDGTCEAIGVYRFDKGQYGDVKLDGLYAVTLYKWPGAVHEGDGEMQLVIDERATPDQKAALEAIMFGQDTDEFATMWNVFALMSPTKHETLTAPITMQYDEQSGIGKATVGKIATIDVAPIPNIVSGEPHHIGIKLRQGFEFTDAVMATATTRMNGSKISLEKNNASHAHVADLHLSGKGIIAA